jgi:hypothetical protein
VEWLIDCCLYSAKLLISDNLRKEATIHFKFPKSFAECVDFEITGQSQLPTHIIQDDFGNLKCIVASLRKLSLITSFAEYKVFTTEKINNVLITRYIYKIINKIYDIQVRYETGTNTNFRVVEWVIDCCLTHFISYWITRVSCMLMMSVLYYTNMLSLIYASWENFIFCLLNHDFENCLISQKINYILRLHWFNCIDGVFG